ncbi:ABC transporter substrate-binding protein [Falsiroseomonas oryziterrae]|uniref:ABC transporter substrate-binding protein n=1 Tax=Falsiroseomonas oryziterrae TaxID=2911368 RepID=UPI001F308154|nr:ABC transporter substrate-binding protein [Roseomonas sp. NPKOSM-4]
MTEGPMIPRRAALTAGLATLAAPATLRAQPRSLRFTLDWTLSGSSAFALAAQRAGFFREEGIEARITRGFGSGRVPVDLGAGTAEIGFGDFSAMARFAAENPQAGMVCVLMVFDGLPLVAVSRADGPIRTPRDLEGRHLAAPEGDAGRQMFPVFADFASFNAGSVRWTNVSPELREPMLVRGQVDAITGFVSSAVLSLQALGMPRERQVVMRYRDFGVPLYSNCLMTTRRFAEANPDIVRGTVRAITRGVRLMVADPAAATMAVKEAEPLVDLAVETERARLVVAEMIMTDHVRRNGLSAVDRARMSQSLEILARVQRFPRQPTPEELYTDAFLPGAADRAMA